MMLNWKRWVCLVLLLATACTLPIPRLVFDTPTPPATEAPPATPLPATLITFNVHVPSNTPAGTAPAVALLDAVGGTRKTVVLTEAANNVWTGSTTATAGAVLRYRYIRPLPTYVEELTPGRERVPFRMVVVDGTAPTVEDTVAAWTDTLYTGETGGLEGRVWNGNSGQGVPGVLVAVGGQVVVTGQDGGFIVYGLPPGQQRAAALAPDGSLRPAQQAAAVAANQIAPIDIISADPNAVHITFLVRPPAGADASAVLRMVGDVWQLGDNFVESAGGSSVTAARAPVLTPLADGRWTVRVLLYAGMVLRYKYTLGDGVWNGELTSTGQRRLREYVVPAADALVDDTISTWKQPGSTSVTFEALTPADTPGGDTVTMQLRPASAWHSPLPMWRRGPNDWRLVLYNPTDFTGSVYYRYCRNAACGTADAADTAGAGATGHFFTPALFGQNLRDTVNRWQWLGPVSGGSGALPAINGRAGFAAGYDLADAWNADALPRLAQTFDAMRADGAGWVTFTRRAAARPGVGSVPNFGDDPALAPLPVAWSEITSIARAVGLKVSLHPVTCQYTPYGVCDYWTGAPFDAAYWNNWFAAYERYLLAQATLARQSNTDLLIIGDFKLRPAFPGEPEAPPDAEARWRGLIAKVRGVYGGPLGFELLLGDAVWPSPPPFLDAVDVIRLWWWSPLATGSSVPATDLIVSAAVLLDSQAQPLQARFNKPLIISAAYLAADGAATQCLRRTDGACYNFEEFEPGAPDTSPYGLDLQEQADAYNALLTAVNDRPWVGGLFSYGYNPMALLRDKSVSVRGKPAEVLLSAWWPKLQGR